MTEHDTKPAAMAPSGVRIAQWFVMAAAAVAGLSFAAVTAPPRLKLLGLFAIALGALAGWIAGRLARWREVWQPRMVAAVTFLLIGAGLVGTTLENHRRYAAAMRPTYAIDPKMAILMRTLERPPGRGEKGSRGDDPFLKAADEHQQAPAERTTLTAYLRHRVRPLGNWSTAAAISLWVAEVLAGSAAGAWVARRTALGAVTPTSDGSSPARPLC